MKVIILAGGLGTRMAEYTETIPKPMVTIGGKPILWHIMSWYAKFGFKDFVIALGYKSEVIKEYFINYPVLNSDFSINLSNGNIKPINSITRDWNVDLINTGSDTLTGGRVKRIRDYIDNETCLLTYGDGLSNVDVASLVEFHKQHGKQATVTAVHPTARFGELQLDHNYVINFKEKPQTASGWINGGYFVLEPEFIDNIEGDHTILEHEPLENAALNGELMAYKHDGFWQCMDTKRDRDVLENLWIQDKAPWKV